LPWQTFSPFIKKESSAREHNPDWKEITADEFRSRDQNRTGISVAALAAVTDVFSFMFAIGPFRGHSPSYQRETVKRAISHIFLEENY
jgi:hypothetical protein